MGYQGEEHAAVTHPRRPSGFCLLFKQRLSLRAALALCGIWPAMAQDNTSAVKACLGFSSPGAGACYPSLSQAKAA